ncbi:TonB-dependent receptor [Pseudotenacibaculum sp. MALMAid0570]|uniref:TonB-dependent receptor n=1 Tax=Pseudotenacibaculum sp. MALMAid0570 TaxID=3143938 RepID=UPI0032DE3A7A
MIKKYYWIIVVVLFTTTMSAQDCNISLKGVVKDFHDGSLISEATVQVEGTKKYAITDKNGVFTLSNLCDSNLWLIVSHVSCDTKRIKVNTLKGNFIEIRLEHHIEELTEVKVTSKTAKKTETSQETVLKTETLQRYSSQSLGDAIKEIPGVSSINTGNAIVKPVINGLHSSRILILTNNVRLQDQEWGIEHAPNIDINSAGSISLIKGANALEFGGDAIGGVIIVNPNRVIRRDTLYGRTIVNGQSNGLGYGLNSTITRSFNSGWFINGQASFKRSGDYEAPDYNLTNTGNISTAFSTNFGYKKLEYGFTAYYSYLKNKIAILRSSHIGNVEDLVNAINSQQPIVINDFSYDISAPKQEVTHKIFKANFYRRFENFGKLDIQYDYQNNRRFEFDIRVGNDRDKPAIDLELETHTLKSVLKLDSNSGKKYKVGALASYQNNFANPDTGVRRLIPDYHKYDFGVFAIGNFELNDQWIFDLGLRYDYNRIDAKKFYITSRWNSQGYNVDFSDIILQDLGTQLLVNPIFNYHNISASVGTSYEVNDDNSLLFNYGLSNRAPNPSELFSDGLHHSAARIELGDLRIQKETSHRISGTYNYKGERFQLNTEVFFNNIQDFIYLEPEGVETTIRGAFPVWEYKQINASLFGIDSDIDYVINNHWNLENKMSFIKGKDNSNNRPLIDIPSFKTVNTIRYKYPKWSGLNLELQSEWVFRQNEYPNNNFEAFIPRTNSFVLVDISTPPPAYHLLNFRGEIDLKISNDNQLNLSLVVNNVLNSSYREYLNRLRYFADELGRNFMIQIKFNY